MWLPRERSKLDALNPTLRANLSATLHADVAFDFSTLDYVFATPVVGGSCPWPWGASSADQPPLNIDSAVTGFGDLYPQAYLKWNQGVHNFMVYGFGDIPVGAYQSMRLANLGIGHGAADAGGGYTYFDPATGHEFSDVAGFTYNLENPSTNYQNGVDFHLNWGSIAVPIETVFCRCCQARSQT